MTDEIKKVAVVKEVNITKTQKHIDKAKENLERYKVEYTENTAGLTEEQIEKAFSQDKQRIERLEQMVAKDEEYLTDVKEVTPVTDMEKGKAVKGKLNKPLKDAI